MAHYCHECFNKYISKKEIPKNDFVMVVDLCEGCSEWKPCVIKVRRKVHWDKKNRVEVFTKENKCAKIKRC